MSQTSPSNSIKTALLGKIELQLEEVKKKKKLLGMDPKPSRVPRNVSPLQKVARTKRGSTSLRLEHPKLEYVLGEIIYSPYMLKVKESYSKKSMEITKTIMEKKAAGVKFKDLAENERPYDIDEVKNEFIQFIRKKRDPSPLRQAKRDANNSAGDDAHVALPVPVETVAGELTAKTGCGSSMAALRSASAVDGLITSSSTGKPRLRPLQAKNIASKMQERTLANRKFSENLSSKVQVQAHKKAELISATEPEIGSRPSSRQNAVARPSASSAVAAKKRSSILAEIEAELDVLGAPSPSNMKAETKNKAQKIAGANAKIRWDKETPRASSADQGNKMQSKALPTKQAFSSVLTKGGSRPAVPGPRVGLTKAALLDASSGSRSQVQNSSESEGALLAASAAAVVVAATDTALSLAAAAVSPGEPPRELELEAVAQVSGDCEGGGDDAWDGNGDDFDENDAARGRARQLLAEEADEPASTVNILGSGEAVAVVSDEVQSDVTAESKRRSQSGGLVEGKDENTYEDEFDYDEVAEASVKQRHEDPGDYADAAVAVALRTSSEEESVYQQTETLVSRHDDDHGVGSESLEPANYDAKADEPSFALAVQVTAASSSHLLVTAEHQSWLPRPAEDDNDYAAAGEGLVASDLSIPTDCLSHPSVANEAGDYYDAVCRPSGSSEDLEPIQKNEQAIVENDDEDYGNDYEDEFD